MGPAGDYDLPALVCKAAEIVAPSCTFSLPAGAGVGKYGAAPKGPQECEDRQKHPGGFITETLPPTAEYSLIYLSKRCPINDFCRRYGYMEYLPYMQP